ncbi:hypothetical protein PMAYCL1PPCAC_33384, partial [Pristionchus mayeri]
KCLCPRGWAGRLCEHRPKDAIIVNLKRNMRNRSTFVQKANRQVVEKLYIFMAPQGLRIKATVGETNYIKETDC